MSKLKELRIKRGLTQKEPADTIGTSRGRFAEYERGDRSITNMTLGNAIKLADALKVRDLRQLVD